MSTHTIPHIAVTADPSSSSSPPTSPTHSSQPERDEGNAPGFIWQPAPDFIHVLPPLDTDSASNSQQYNPQSDPGLLSPLTAGGSSRRPSWDASRPTTPSEAGSLNPPPSPTLSSSSSVHFKTSTALRDNRPEDRSPFLTPDNTFGRQHRRKGSNATWMSSMTEGGQSFLSSSFEGGTDLDDDDGRPLRRAKSNATSITTAPSPTATLHVDYASDHSRSPSRSRSQTRGKRAIRTEEDYHEMELADAGAASRPPSRPTSAGKQQQTQGHDDGAAAKDDAASTTAHAKRLELAQDADDVDCGPFAFGPYALASMLDPKNLAALDEMGGVCALLRGLGTHHARGLCKRAAEERPVSAHRLSHEDEGGEGSHKSGVGGQGAGRGVSQRYDRQDGDRGGGGTDAAPPPGIVVTSPKIVVTSPVEPEPVPLALSPKVEDTPENPPLPEYHWSIDMAGEHSGKTGDEEEGGPADDGDEPPPYSASLEVRRAVYGANVLPHRPSKSLLQLMWLALKDKVLVLLSVAAVVSLALGLFQDLGPDRPVGQPPVDWVEGVAIIIAIFIVVIVGSLNDWQKERQFKTLNNKKEERGLKVIRDGQEKVIDVKDVVVGDIALLEPGEIVPVDGVFLGGHNVRCDESGATGESDAIRKLSYEECAAIRQKEEEEKGRGRAEGVHGEEHEVPGEVHGMLGEELGALKHTDCFIVSGSKVLEGMGSYVVVAVGTKSFNGRIMMALRGDAENTPLQLKLNALAELIAKLGSAAGLVLFVALMIRFFVGLGTGTPHRTPSQQGMAFVQILIISVTLVVVAVPEGLPLAVTLALAFATKRMTHENLLVRVLGSCETMANASVVCTDKTGTLTQNSMTVVAGSVGIHAKFVRNLSDNQSRSNAEEEVSRSGSAASSQDPVKRKHPDDFSLDQAQLNTVLTPAVRALFNAAIAVNSTAFEDEDRETGQLAFVGSKTETALLKFAQELGWEEYRTARGGADVVQMLPFSSARKAMGVVVKCPGRERWRLYLKGASEILTKKCTSHVVVYRDAEAHEEIKDVETAPIGELESDNISRTIIFYANQTLRTIALCYRDFECWPPKGAAVDDEDDVSYDDLAHDLTLIGIVGIEDPLREGVREAVMKCHKAGVSVKMCTGDNVLTARSIALQCGIFTEGGIIMEGPIFRQLSESEMLEIVPRLHVLARSSPEDKKLLVEKLRALGEIVGVTGDGTNDGPALKTADVGFSMGIAGTEVAKEASDIILMDDNFASIVKAIMWGRCVNDAVRKFLQFQVTTNVTSVIITTASAVASTQEVSVLSAVQLLWINIIMDTFAALALATDPASELLLDRKPDKKFAPLFSVDMYKQILFQSLYQVVVILIFHFAGNSILGLDHSTHSDEIVQTLVFNAFVFAQIFNSVNCRRLDKKLNIFEGILRNYYFIAITGIEIVGQVLIVFIGGSAFQVTRIGGREWGISLALGFVSMPLGALIRLMPNRPFEKLFRKMRLQPKENVLPTTRPEQEWNAAIELVRDNLGTFANLRGGRLRSSSFVVNSRSAKLKEEAMLPLPSLMTMVPTIVASSIGAGWAPHQPGSLSDPAHSDPSKSSAALWDGRMQVHPGTKKDDPIYTHFLKGPQQPPS